MPKLFIPGPTEVRPEVLAACARPMIGHRSAACAALYQSISERLQRLIGASGPVMLVTSSAQGVMEACLRGLVAQRLLAVVSGAWGARFCDIADGLELPYDRLDVPPGQAAKPAQVAAALAAGDYDAVTVVFNETATGVVQPVQEIAAVVKADPERLMIVDAVSAMAAEPIAFDAWGLDACLAGLQKAFACPPGMAILALSQAAQARIPQTSRRGWYLDLAALLTSHRKWQTLSTPVIPVMQALDVQLDRIAAEGMDARHRRHVEMAELTRAWAADRFGLFAEAGYRSITLTTVANTRRIDVAGLIKRLEAAHDAVIGNGYSALKEQTFRIGHMGDLTPDEIRELLGWLDGLL